MADQAQVKTVADNLMSLAKDVVGTEFDYVIVESLAGNGNAQSILHDKSFQDRMFQYTQSSKRPTYNSFLKDAIPQIVAFGMTGLFTLAVNKICKKITKMK